MIKVFKKMIKYTYCFVQKKVIFTKMKGTEETTHHSNSCFKKVDIFVNV